MKSTMDYKSLPVAKRTRSKRAEMLEQEICKFDKGKKRKKSDHGEVGIEQIERMNVEESTRSSSSSSSSSENEFVDIESSEIKESADSEDTDDDDDYSLESETKNERLGKKAESFRRREQKYDNGDVGERMKVEKSSSGCQEHEYVVLDASSESEESGSDNTLETEIGKKSQFLGKKVETLRKSKETQMFSKQKSDIEKVGSEESSSGSQEIEFVEILDSQGSSDSDDDYNVEAETEVSGKRNNLGSLEDPISVDREEDSDYFVRGSKSKVGKVEEKNLRQSTRKRKRGCDDLEIAQILANSMFGDEEGPVLDEEIVKPVTQPSLPLKVTFGVEEKIPVEKSEEDKEIDKLWAEMALALYADGTIDDLTDTNEAELSTNVEPTSAVVSCRQGKHCLVLDEEIGIICKFCSFVETEIRHYTAPFCKHPYRNSSRQDSYWEQDDTFDKFHHQGMDYDAEPGTEFYSHLQGTVWSIIPGIGRDLHPHQREGFEFLWKNIGGGIHLDNLKGLSANGSGCIISHAPGTGKTRLAIVFLQTYMKLYPTCRPVIIAPQGLLLAWEAEFKKWNFNIPFHNLNQLKFCGNENASARGLVDSGQHSKNLRRMVKLYSWKCKMSVLALSYTLFKDLVIEGEKKTSVREKKEDSIMQKIRKALLEFPDLVVLDEGHVPRNEQSLIWKALSKIQTKKRIILSGTPFQNNFEELFNTLHLVRPQFADSSHNKSRCKSKKNGARLNWSSLTSSIGKEFSNDMKAAKSLEELRAMIRPFVHIHRGNILQQKLPGLRDAVVILRPRQLQKRLLDRLGEIEKNNYLGWEHSVSVVSVHPSLMPKGLAAAEYGTLESSKLNPELGVKTKFLMELIKLSKALNEKVLVFSQYLDPLKLIRKQLAEQFKWIKGKEILYMHGSVDTYERLTMIKSFNDENDESKVLLASTKACSEGINLVGASRVVLLDVVWNPSVGRQAICRAYRLGQKKVVYVYHLIASGMEENKYSRQGEKERLSNLVFYSSEKNHKKLKSTINDDKRDKILEAMVEGNKLKDILKEIRYPRSFDDSFALLDQ